VERLAWNLAETLRDSCVRIQVAGGVRRKKPNPSDIEIVVEPLIEWEPVTTQIIMFGPEPLEMHPVNLFDERCKELIRRGVLEKRRHTSRRWACPAGPPEERTAQRLRQYLSR
jgi:hypothetical protein